MKSFRPTALLLACALAACGVAEAQPMVSTSGATTWTPQRQMWCSETAVTMPLYTNACSAYVLPCLPAEQRLVLIRDAREQANEAGGLFLIAADILMRRFRNIGQRADGERDRAGAQQQLDLAQAELAAARALPACR
jgi:hypothetical protein